MKGQLLGSLNAFKCLNPLTKHMNINVTSAAVGRASPNDSMHAMYKSDGLAQIKTISVKIIFPTIPLTKIERYSQLLDIFLL
jgi:hypothetical protein